MREQEIRDEDMKIDIIESDGTIRHYNINDLNGYNHAYGFYIYVKDFKLDENNLEMQLAIESKIHDAIESCLVSRLNRIIHKSLIVDEVECHIFRLPITEVTKEAQKSYEQLKHKFYDDEELDMEEAKDNIWGFSFKKSIEKRK